LSFIPKDAPLNISLAISDGKKRLKNIPQKDGKNTSFNEKNSSISFNINFQRIIHMNQAIKKQIYEVVIRGMLAFWKELINFW